MFGFLKRLNLKKFTFYVRKFFLFFLEPNRKTIETVEH